MLTEPPSSRRTALRALAWVGLILLALLVYGRINSWRKAGEVAGIYLTKGGRSLLVLERGLYPSLEATRGILHTLSSSFGMVPVEIAVGVHQSDGTLQLTQTEAFQGFPDPPDRGVAFLFLELAPSTQIEGDWDLVSGEFRLHYPSIYRFTSALGVLPLGPGAGGGSGAVGNFVGGVVKFFGNVGGAFRKMKEDLLSRYKPEWLPPNHTRAFGPPSSPIPSFLHRIDDDRLIGYFDKRAEDRFGEVDVAAFREILADHPDDPYLMVHAIDVEAQYGDLSRAVELMESWEPGPGLTSNSLLEEAAQVAFKSVAKAQSRPEGDDLRELLAFFCGEENNLHSRMEFLEGHLEYDTLVDTTWPLVDPSLERSAELAKLPDYLELQFNARIARTLALLHLFEGRREESLRLLTGLYRQGQMMNADGPLIQRLIGIAIRLTAMEGLQIQLLNACESPEELRDLLASLEKSNQIWEPQTLASLVEEDDIRSIPYLKVVGGPRYAGTYVRQQFVDTNFRLLRAAASSRLFRLEEGTFPRSKSDFERYLAGGLPEDSFGEGPLGIVESATEGYTLFSVGPDGDDDRGSLHYSPTNGTKSDGDLLVNIPTERKFPFRKNGFERADADEILNEFQHGLPVDLFRFGYNQGPLSILDATLASPLKVFGFGPIGTLGDRITNARLYEIPGMIAIQEVGADSLNTGTRHGDTQFVFTPKSQGPLTPEEEQRLKRWEGLTPKERDLVEFASNPKTHPEFLFRGQPSPEEAREADSRNERISRLREEGRLDPSLYLLPGKRPGPLKPFPYDPTNGVRSEGQIFIEDQD